MRATGIYCARWRAQFKLKDLWLPLVIVLQLALVLCISLALSALSVFIRDSEQSYQVLLRLLFFGEAAGDCGTLLRFLDGMPNYSLTIFMYHAVVQRPLTVFHWCFVAQPVFRAQMAYLKHQFDLLPLGEAVERLREGTLVRPTAVVTFDDGFQNNFDIVFPILREYTIPAAIFLVSGQVGTSDTLWYCRIHRALTLTTNPALEWRSRRFDLGSATARNRAVSRLAAELKKLPHPQLTAEVRCISHALAVDPDQAIGSDSPYRMLSPAALAEMQQSGLVEFGAHTQSHAILSLLSEAEQRAEIESSVQSVSAWTGNPCRLFAYPNGRAVDYDEGTLQMLDACGIRIALTTIERRNDARTPLLELRRYGIGADWAGRWKPPLTRLVAGAPLWQR